MRWVEVPLEIVERARVAREAARGSNKAWEAFVGSLTPGHEMDVVAMMSVIGDASVMRRRPDGAPGAPCVSSDVEQAMRLVYTSESTLSVTYRPAIRATDPPDEVRAEVYASAHDGSTYSGEWVHRPPEDFRDPDDLVRIEAERDGDPEDAGDYHECGKSRCLADAITRALLLMYSPTEEELTSHTGVEREASNG